MDQLLTHLAGNHAIYLLIALLVALAALVAGLFGLLRLRAVSRPFGRIDTASQDPAAVLGSILNLVEGTDSGLARLRTDLEEHIGASRAFLRHVGFVRYDAFEDIAGQQSYSLCLLDGAKNGVLISYLTGKSSTRSYAIKIENGEAPRRLSDEESHALDEALSRRPVVETHAG